METTTKIPELDKLFSEIGTYRSSSDFYELFSFIKKFPRIAPFNAMLIHIQKPGSDFVASATVWKREFNRFIKPGARPLLILQPFAPVAFVFELGDTDGDNPFPNELINPFEVKGEVPEHVYNRLIDNLSCDGVLYSEADHGTSSAGFIQKINYKDTQTIFRNKKEYLVKVLYSLNVNRNHPIETKFATILHELGHLYCGHLGSPDQKWWKDRSKLGLNEREFEAECVCWLICERMGIQNPSAKYLNDYLDKNEFIPKISVDTVLKSVAMIESMINGRCNPRKELLLAIYNSG